MNLERLSTIVRERFNHLPTAIVLGSGLSFLKDQLSDSLQISYEEIDGHPLSTVMGHHGSYNFGYLDGVPLVLVAGRHHYYEGYELDNVLFYQKVLRVLGVKNLVLTNATGGLGDSLKPGDLMGIVDYLNFSSSNVVKGSRDNKPFHEGVNFLTQYFPDLKKGVYGFMTGPSFETPAEISMLKRFGVDAVGMSTVPEIVGGEGFNRVLALSCITNYAAGIIDQPLTHQEVFETAESAKGSFKDLIKKIVKGLDI
jgi:purine-nucleoside phosphorylase